MENRAELLGTGGSKWLVTLFAVIVALSLAAVMAAYMAKSAGAPAESVTTQAGYGAYEPAEWFDGSGQWYVP